VNATVHTVTKTANDGVKETKTTVNCALSPETGTGAGSAAGALFVALAAAGAAVRRRRG
jgi:hypothetical protein